MKPVFVFKKKFYCESCGLNLRLFYTDKKPANPNDLASYSSEKYPKGPQTLDKARDELLFCGRCGEVLLNPLTDTGIKTVLSNMHAYSTALRDKVIAEYKLKVDMCSRCKLLSPPADGNLRCIVCGYGEKYCKACISACPKHKTILCAQHRRRCGNCGWNGCSTNCVQIHEQNVHQRHNFSASGAAAYAFSSDTEEEA